MSPIDKAALKLIGYKTVADTLNAGYLTFQNVRKSVLMEEAWFCELMQCDRKYQACDAAYQAQNHTYYSAVLL